MHATQHLLWILRVAAGGVSSALWRPSANKHQYREPLRVNTGTEDNTDAEARHQQVAGRGLAPPHNPSTDILYSNLDSNPSTDASLATRLFQPVFEFNPSSTSTSDIRISGFSLVVKPQVNCPTYARSFNFGITYVWHTAATLVATHVLGINTSAAGIRYFRRSFGNPAPAKFNQFPGAQFQPPKSESAKKNQATRADSDAGPRLATLILEFELEGLGLGLSSTSAGDFRSVFKNSKPEKPTSLRRPWSVSLNSKLCWTVRFVFLSAIITIKQIQPPAANELWPCTSAAVPYPIRSSYIMISAIGVALN
ncbi:hypothetical protein B0H14DRAFT_2579690 [Mycena olivaceomarginata]|nr:hypothetical protein B0H14DRAFT_2579690 [Mycena olivaceomarginata]